MEGLGHPDALGVYAVGVAVQIINNNSLGIEERCSLANPVAWGDLHLEGHAVYLVRYLAGSCEVTDRIRTPDQVGYAEPGSEFFTVRLARGFCAATRVSINKSHANNNNNRVNNSSHGSSHSSSHSGPGGRSQGPAGR